MAQHTVVFVISDQIKQFLVIAFIIFFLASAPLKILRPEFLIFNLMDRQDDEIKKITGKKSFILRNGMCLHAKFQTGPDVYAAAVFRLHPADFSHIRRIIHIGKGLVSAPADFHSGIPVILHPVIYMICKTDFIHPHLNGVPHDRLHGVDGIIAEFRMYVIVCKHIVFLSLFSDYIRLQKNYKGKAGTPQQLRRKGCRVPAPAVRTGEND